MTQCSRCGGGLPGETDQVCQCGRAWGDRPRKAGLRRTGFKQHGAGLAPGKPLARTATLARSPAAGKPAAKKTTPRKVTVPPAIRVAALIRADGDCECCGKRLPEKGTHMHHRDRQGQCGADTLDNVMAVRPYCHVLGKTAIHELVGPAQGKGFLLRRGEAPADTPILLHGVRLVRLHPTEPRYVDMPDEMAQPA